MTNTGKVLLRVCVGVVLASLSTPIARAEDPCAKDVRRALVLSGGGAKGAFEAGAIYHLIVQRHCDFSEFSGASVGALNGAFLAQAEKSSDANQSLTNLSAEAEGLISLWQSIKSSKDIRKERHFAMLRWGLFGLENMNDMTPLRHLLNRNISMEKLANGRPVRASVVSFWTGEYREVVAQPALSKFGKNSFLEYLYASSTIPVYAKLPRIADGSASDDPKMWPQFSDSGVRHITPLSSYFKVCNSQWATASSAPTAKDSCVQNESAAAPPHESVEQLFVVVTSPFSRDSDELPITDAKCCKAGTRQLTDGRKILGRTLALMDDSVYRSDLNFSLIANNIVRWRWQAYNRLVLTAPAGQVTDAKQFMAHENFVIESYNRDKNETEAPSRPYEIGLIAPKKELSDAAHLLVLSPPIIQQQLYCGCIAADEMMIMEFGLPSLANKCAQRFPRLTKLRYKASVRSADWDVNTCKATTNAGLELATETPIGPQQFSREVMPAGPGNTAASGQSYSSQEQP